jgi:DNA helicase II / ATP-dependent DNA helicase PcrA
MATSAFVPSPEQVKVIAHRGGHLQVVACAGAGKTEAISRRVSMLIEEGVEPAQIVAFTFTERAATSLKNRVTRRGRCPSKIAGQPRPRRGSIWE